MAKELGPLHKAVLKMLDDIEELDNGNIGLSEEKFTEWATLLGSKYRKEIRIYVDCIRAAEALFNRNMMVAGGQFLAMSGVGLSDAELIEKSKERGIDAATIEEYKATTQPGSSGLAAGLEPSKPASGVGLGVRKPR